MTDQTIPEAELVKRRLYRVRSRNLISGVWTGLGFSGIRSKFDNRYLFTEYLNHTAWPLEALVDMPEDIELWETYPTTCLRCGERVDWSDKREPRWQHVYVPTEHDVMPIGRIYMPLFQWIEDQDEDYAEAHQSVES